MPRIARRGPTRRPGIDELTRDVERQLRCGLGFLEPLTTSQLESAWESFGEEVMERWLADRGNLFTRPFAWWVFVAVPRHGERRTLRSRVSPALLHGIRTQVYSGPRFEPYLEDEDVYLRRHKLLTPTEKRIDREFT